MITLKNAQLESISVAIGELNGEGGLPPILSYRFGVIAKEIGAKLELLTEAKKKILEQFGNGKEQLSPEDEEYSKVFEELAPILKLEVELNAQKIPLEEYSKIEKPIAIQTSANLLPIIEE